MDGSDGTAIPRDASQDDPIQDGPIQDGPIQEDSGDVYDRHYYMTHCGPVPYQWSEAQWSSFFGSIAEQLIRAFRPRRVFDAGCAHGFLVAALWARGVETWGRDISAFAISEARQDIRPYCSVGSIAAPIEGSYDLVTCIEVLEHMHEQAAVEAVAAMTSVTDRILFSSSPTDFDEPTHINVRPPLYWLHLFAQHGFAPLLAYDASYLTPHAVVLERIAADRPAEEVLVACAELIRARLIQAERDRTIHELRGQQEEARRALEEARRTAEAELDAAQALAQSQQDKMRGEMGTEISALRGELDRLVPELARATWLYQSIAGSTLWRLTGPVRRMAGMIPIPVRRRLRKSLGLVRLGATLRIGRLRQELGAARHARAAPLQAAGPTAEAGPVAGAAGQAGTSSRSDAYDQYLVAEQIRLDAELGELERHAGLMPYRPTFTILIDQSSGTAAATILSLEKQIWADWQIVEGSGFPYEDGPAIQGDFIVFLRAGDRLARDALYAFASALNAEPALDLIYADEDSLDSTGRRAHPFFKPGWSPDYLESLNYIGPAACFRAEMARPHFDASGLYDFTLRFTEADPKIAHLEKILCHRGPTPPEKTGDAAAEIQALEGRLRRTGRQGTARPGVHGRGYYDVTLTAREHPLVSIVIPTAGKIVSRDGRDLDLLANCIGSILTRSTYRHFEIVLVDNGDIDDARKAALEGAGCRFVTYREPEFNLPRKLNLGVEHAAGELLILMNDDMEIVTPDWIERMLDHFQKPHVGIVGIKLLYPDGAIQHAGVVHNFGNPDHVRRVWPRDDQGYFFSSCAVRNFSAVTGACTMTRRDVYRQVAGYTDHLVISYNDADYCQKIRELGLFVVYVPNVELIHFESQSREAKLSETDSRYYHRRWAREIVSDPFYNELCLTVASPTFEVCPNERVV